MKKQATDYKTMFYVSLGVILVMVVIGSLSLAPKPEVTGQAIYTNPTTNLQPATETDDTTRLSSDLAQLQEDVAFLKQNNILSVLRRCLCTEDECPEREPLRPTEDPKEGFRCIDTDGGMFPEKEGKAYYVDKNNNPIEEGICYDECAYGVSNTKPNGASNSNTVQTSIATTNENGDVPKYKECYCQNNIVQQKTVEKINSKQGFCKDINLLACNAEGTACAEKETTNITIGSLTTTKPAPEPIKTTKTLDSAAR
jgi:hypothetical protein